MSPIERLRGKVSEPVIERLERVPEGLLHDIARTSFDDITRWQGVEMPEGFEETNADHVLGMLDMLHDLWDSIPDTEKSEWSLADMEAMILIHDSMEGHKSVGDVPAYQVGMSDEVRHKHSMNKKRERRFGRLAVTLLISEERDRKYWLDLWNRYHDQQDGDVEARIVKFLDKLQASEVIRGQNYTQEQWARISLESVSDEHQTRVAFNVISVTEKALTPMKSLNGQPHAREYIQDIVLSHLFNHPRVFDQGTAFCEQAILLESQAEYGDPMECSMSLVADLKRRFRLG